ncbi:MAG TPA: YdjY domain-containing protein [Planctomycetota bacterium]
MIAVLLGLALQALEKPAVDGTTVSFGAVTLKPEVYAQLKGAIEYVLVNKGGKAYESVFESAVDPMALYEGLKKLGAAPGRPAREEDEKKLPPEGGKLRIFVEWKDGDKARKEPIGAFVLDTTTGKPMGAADWIFTGSKKGFIPDLERQDLLVLVAKNLVALHHSDPTVLATNPTASADGNRYKANKELLPKEGTPVKVIFEAVR